MPDKVRVTSPPLKPLLVYDGDCRFCTLWIRRWQGVTGDLIDYLPAQDPQVSERFPEIPREEFESSVQLIEPEGSVYRSAEAIFRSLARNPHYVWLAEFYQHFPAFAKITDWLYRFVAKHRSFFSFITRLLWGQHVEQPSYVFVRRAFLSCLGIIYLIAFVSLWVQIDGLMGSHGIVPVSQTMESLRQGAVSGLSRFFHAPTLCWISSSDSFLLFQCAAGSVLAVLLILGIAPAPSLFLLWLIYLSLCTVGEPFMDFQWDILLLEAGFLAIFFAPWHWLPRHPLRETPPSRVVIWLFRWLLFKLMFQSGCVELTSGDPTWRNLTALNFHFETQPLPTWIGWYVHQLPAWIHRSDTRMLFVIELGIPFLIFLPRRPRQLACLAFLALQIFILLTGNYSFFNLLTMVLCLVLLDDAALKTCLPGKWCACEPSPNRPVSASLQIIPPLSQQIHSLLLVPLVAIIVITSGIQFSEAFHVIAVLPPPISHLYRMLIPFRSFNGYGLFAVMTTSRPEIVIEGSNDGVNWQAYEFKYKPGDLKHPPAFVAPHQPRLDWQMWFAALSDYRNNPWFLNFCARLLEDSPQVLALLERNPFPNAPPKYIRATVYQYHFTDNATRRMTGEWWRRETDRIYLPAISLQKESGGPSGLPAAP